MKTKVVVLGCGLVGRTMAWDLSADPTLEVAVSDINQNNLQRAKGIDLLATIQTDLSTPDAVKALVSDFDMVVGAMPSALGFQTAKAVIEAGKSYSDISFMIEDPMELDDLAKQHGVTVVFDCGVAPGLSNMIIGHCDAQLDETMDVVFYVGGLPKRRIWPYQYKAPFAPADVIEEYTRPARMVENGRIVVKPALTEPEPILFPQVGTLEAFLTDGLRSLVHTIGATNMKEKTLRYPGHCELMRVLRETGLFSKEEIKIDGTGVCPLKLTSKLLFDLWRLEPDEKELTVMRVIVKGNKDGRRMSHTYDLYDEYDETTAQHSMARTTGFPNAIMARWIMRGHFTEPGVHPPECVGRLPGMLDQMLGELADRGITMSKSTERENDGSQCGGGAG